MNRFILITYLLTSGFSFSQTIQSRVARENSLDQSSNHTLMGVTNNRLLSFSEKKESIHIDIYDTDSLNLLYHEQLQLLGSNGSQLEIQGVYRMKDQFKLVATGKMTAKQFGVFVYSILENGKLSETFEQTFFDLDSEFMKIRTQVQINKDQSLLVVRLAFEKKDVVYRTLVYDENLMNVFKLEHTPVPASTSNHNYTVSYFPGKDHLYELNEEILYDKQVKRFKTVLELKKYDFKSGESIAKQSLTLADGFMLADIRFKEQGDEVQLIASHLISYHKAVNGIRGIYIARFNKSDLSLKSAKSTAISVATKAKSLKGYENADELDVPLLYGLNSYLTDGKGNDYLLYERTSKTTSSGLTEYYYGSIIAVKINPDGVVEWDTFISKSQFFKEKGIPILFVVPGVVFSAPFSIRFSKDSRQYLSFKPILKNDELYLICNDNPKNEGKTSAQGRENMTNIDQSVPFAIHLSPAGSVDYQMLKELKIGLESQRIIYSVVWGTTMFTLRDSGKTETLQRIVFE